MFVLLIFLFSSILLISLPRFLDFESRATFSSRDEGPLESGNGLFSIAFLLRVRVNELARLNELQITE